MERYSQNSVRWKAESFKSVYFHFLQNLFPSLCKIQNDDTQQGLYSELDMGWMLFPPQIHMLKPEPTIQQGLWEVIKVKTGHMGGVFRMEIMLLRMLQRASGHTLSPPSPYTPLCENTARRWPPTSQEENPHQDWIDWHLDLGLLASRTVTK